MADRQTVQATRPRLVDVAARAGVSTATASLVLRERPGPSDSARAAVRAAARDLGYRPDRTASLLARHRTRLLGVLLDVTSAFHAELVRALDDAAADRGLDLVMSTVTPRRDEQRAAETLLDFRCEALVVLGPSMPAHALDALAVAVPVVAVGRGGTTRVPGVLASDDLGLELAVDHLVGLGHERITFVDGPRGSIATARRRGYRRAMRRHGLGARVEVLPGGSTEADGAGAADVVLTRTPADRPTAMVGFNDRCAIGLRDTLVAAGCPVPGAVSVVGYDDSPLARPGTVGLTSVSQDPVGLAAATVELIVGRLDEPGEAPRGSDVVISPRLVVRSSTAPPAPA